MRGQAFAGSSVLTTTLTATLTATLSATLTATTMAAVVLCPGQASAEPRNEAAVATPTATMPAVLPMVIHVAMESTPEGPRPVASEEHIRGAVARASEILLQAGICFQLEAIRPLPTGK